MNFKLIGAAAALSMMMAAGAQAATVTYMAMLDGKSEVPANAEKGTGLVEATLDTATKVLTYSVSYKDLTGPATAAHFHAGAVGANGPPVVPVPAAAVAANPIKGTATLTDAQIAQFDTGGIYFNIHTAAHGPGEIRGQVMKH
jgi:hypothetical protein